MNGPVLEVANLRKRFVDPDGTPINVIDIECFMLARGEHAALKGTSGSGKTTFLNLIAGILRADSGRIIIDSHDTSGMTESRRDRLRATTIGYVFQNSNLLQGYTALENVMLGMLFGAGVEGRRAQELLERVGLGHRLSYRPRQLSVGQQQRVAVARALANRPKLVLADEPTGNLDPHNAQEALTLVREVCRENGAALLLVSHDAAILPTFDRVDDLYALNRAAAAPARAAN